MLLFILESLGTSELILIGIVALIFLGPRRLPEIAKKAGKIMAEFRGTASEFKETWQREVDFEEEKKALDLDSIEAEAKPVAREEPASAGELPAVPQVTEADPDVIKERIAAAQAVEEVGAPEPEKPEFDSAVNDKRNWL